MEVNMPSNILSINKELCNYFSDINYGMSKSQFHNLTTIANGLINLSGSKSLLKISKAVLTAKNSSSIYRFLSHSKWDDSLIDKNRDRKSTRLNSSRQYLVCR